MPNHCYNRVQISNDAEDNSKQFDELVAIFESQKPFSKIPHYTSSPKSIFISAMPTEPFAIDYEDLFGYCENYLQDGINALKFIFKCDIYFSSFDNSSVFFVGVKSPRLIPLIKCLSGIDTEIL